jgi:hypothetical protein
MPQSKLHILPHEVGVLVRITSTKLGFASLHKHVGFLIKFVKSKISQYIFPSAKVFFLFFFFTLLDA